MLYEAFISALNIFEIFTFDPREKLLLLLFTFGTGESPFVNEVDTLTVPKSLALEKDKLCLDSVPC